MIVLLHEHHRPGRHIGRLSAPQFAVHEIGACGRRTGRSACTQADQIADLHEVGELAPAAEQPDARARTPTGAAVRKDMPPSQAAISRMGLVRKPRGAMGVEAVAIARARRLASPRKAARRRKGPSQAGRRGSRPASPRPAGRQCPLRWPAASCRRGDLSTTICPGQHGDGEPPGPQAGPRYRRKRAHTSGLAKVGP